VGLGCSWRGLGVDAGLEAKKHVHFLPGGRPTLARIYVHSQQHENYACECDDDFGSCLMCFLLCTLE